MGSPPIAGGHAERTAPTYLIRDNDSTFGPAFARVAAASGVESLRTPYRAPRVNAICERFLGSVRREYLDHLLIPGEAPLRRVLRTYVTYFNGARPHQGIAQQVPVGVTPDQRVQWDSGPIHAAPILGGLHHAYQRAA